MRFCFTLGPHPPVAKLRAGERVKVACPDSDGFDATGRPIAPELLHGSRGGSAAFPGNPLAGPFDIEHLRAGDTLAVRIESIHLDRPTGRTLLAPGHGLVPTHLLVDDPARTPSRHMYEWVIDTTARVARLTNPLGRDLDLVVPLSPFVGCIGTCPRYAQEISTLYAGPHGGNMDLPFLASGAMLLLPAFADGGLLGLGDIHAAQGHGEIVGGGVETSGEITFSCIPLPGDGLEFPRAIAADRLYAVGSDGDLRHAVQVANANLLHWLDRWLGMNRFDAYQLLSQCGGLTLGNGVTAPYSAGASIEIAALPARARGLVRQFVEALP
jgi:acetamidase/formamidase